MPKTYNERKLDEIITKMENDLTLQKGTILWNNLQEAKNEKDTFQKNYNLMNCVRTMFYEGNRTKQDFDSKKENLINFFAECEYELTRIAYEQTVGNPNNKSESQQKAAKDNYNTMISAFQKGRDVYVKNVGINDYSQRLENYKNTQHAQYRGALRLAQSQIVTTQSDVIENDSLSNMRTERKVEKRQGSSTYQAFQEALEVFETMETRDMTYEQIREATDSLAQASKAYVEAHTGIRHLFSAVSDEGKARLEAARKAQDFSEKLLKSIDKAVDSLPDIASKITVTQMAQSCGADLSNYNKAEITVRNEKVNREPSMDQFKQNFSNNFGIDLNDKPKERKIENKVPEKTKLDLNEMMGTNPRPERKKLQQELKNNKELQQQLGRTTNQTIPKGPSMGG